MLLISACLLGAKVKYNGSSNYCTLLAKYKDCGLFIPICPECLGQLTIPRLPAEITGGDGSDVLNGTAKYTTMLAIMLQKILSKVLKLLWKSPAENK